MAMASALEPFRVANRMLQENHYQSIITSVEGSSAKSSGELIVQSHSSYDQHCDAQIIVLCASFEPESAVTPALLNWLKHKANHGCTIIGIDTGAHIMALAGILDGLRATVHWEHQDIFRQRFSRVICVDDLYTLERKRYSAAGGTACLDLMLHIIQEQQNREVASAVADQFIYARLRPSHAKQKLTPASRLKTQDPRVIQTIALMESHLEDPMTTSQLASSVNVSLRKLERIFKRQLDTTPGHYYRSLRLQKAQSLLLHSDLKLNDIANLCGFSSASSFSRLYRSVFGIAPREHRLSR